MQHKSDQVHLHVAMTYRADQSSMYVSSVPSLVPRLETGEGLKPSFTSTCMHVIIAFQ